MVECCDALNGKMLNQDKHGFSVYKDEMCTYLKFLAIDEDEIDQFVETVMKCEFESKPTNIKISGEVVIRFCPFCGEKIKF
jgi:hypothetical protein